MSEYPKIDYEWIDGLSNSLSEGFLRIGRKLRLGVVKIEKGNSFAIRGHGEKILVRPNAPGEDCAFSICLATCAKAINFKNLSDTDLKRIIVDISIFFVGQKKIEISVIHGDYRKSLAFVDVDKESVDFVPSGQPVMVNYDKISGANRLVVASAFDLTARLHFLVTQDMSAFNAPETSPPARCEIDALRVAIV